MKMISENISAPSLLLYSLAFLFLMGCGKENIQNIQEETITMPSIQNVPESAWQALSSKKIYFGHQSVGNNILDGVQKIGTRDNHFQFNIVETDSPAIFNKAVWAHSNIGANGDPSSKIEAFKANIQKGIGNNADIAFLKFCFWDIRASTDVEKVFRNYKQTMSELIREYPKMKFVHFTVPLMSYPNGLTSKIRRLLGMPIGFDLDNIKRNKLNRLILQEFSGKQPILDIAQWESTLPDGKRTFFVKGGQNYYYLASVYTDDGGHLNEEGRKHIAEQVLITLSRVAEETSRSSVIATP